MSTFVCRFFRAIPAQGTVQCTPPPPPPSPGVGAEPPRTKSSRPSGSKQRPCFFDSLLCDASRLQRLDSAHDPIGSLTAMPSNDAVPA